MTQNQLTSSILRGTTPIARFTSPVDPEDIAVMYMTFAQNGRPILEKSLGDFTFEGRVATTQLSQNETLLFDISGHPIAEVQVRIRTTDNRAFGSNILKFDARKILKNGEI